MAPVAETPVAMPSSETVLPAPIEKFHARIAEASRLVFAVLKLAVIVPPLAIPVVKTL